MKTLRFLLEFHVEYGFLYRDWLTMNGIDTDGSIALWQHLVDPPQDSLVAVGDQQRGLRPDQFYFTMDVEAWKEYMLPGAWYYWITKLFNDSPYRATLTRINQRTSFFSPYGSSLDEYYRGYLWLKKPEIYGAGYPLTTHSALYVVTSEASPSYPTEPYDVLMKDVFLPRCVDFLTPGILYQPNGKVDIAEIAATIKRFGHEKNLVWDEYDEWAYDITADLKIDIKDVAILSKNFGWVAPT